MKKEDASKDKIPQGTLFIEPSKDNLINFIAWKDNALVLFMSTIDDGSQVIKKLRKRPLETSSFAKTLRVPFNRQARALFNILVFNDLYNHRMGYVDEGNHLKATNICTRKCYKGGHQFLVIQCLDTILVNLYLLSFHSLVPVKEKWTNQEKFRIAIIKECFALRRQACFKRRRSLVITISLVLETPLDSYHLQRKEYSQDCVVCKKEGILRAIKQRRVLREVSSNKAAKRVRSRCKKSTRFGCDVCNTPLCKDSTCQARFHSEEWK